MKMTNFNFEKLVYNTYYIPFNVNLNHEGSFYGAANNCIYLFYYFIILGYYGCEKEGRGFGSYVGESEKNLKDNIIKIIIKKETNKQLHTNMNT
jgi:hypothetical protein